MNHIVFWKIISKFDEDNEIISYFFKLGLRNDIDLNSSIIYQFPSIDSKKFKYYEFPVIEEQYLQEKSISKYEIPQYIQDIPDGFSIFCTLWEASKVKQYIQLNKEEQDKLNLRENIVKKDNNNICFNEPLPKTNFCYLCQRRFEDYLVHIGTVIHKNCINQNPLMIKNVQNTFKRINNFWDTKNIIQKDNDKKSDNENKNGYSISSLSSISSFNNILKFENNKNIIRINIDFSQDNTDNDNIDNEIENKDNYNKNEDQIINNEDVKKKGDSVNYSLIESYNNNSIILLKKKRKILINEKDKENNNSNDNNIKKKDYFDNLSIYNNKKLINDVTLLFK